MEETLEQQVARLTKERDEANEKVKVVTKERDKLSNIIVNLPIKENKKMDKKEVLKNYE